MIIPPARRTTSRLLLLSGALLVACGGGGSTTRLPPPHPLPTTVPLPPSVEPLPTPATSAPEVAWTRKQVPPAWDIAYPAGWTVHEAGAHEGTVELHGAYQGPTYEVRLALPRIGKGQHELETWVEQDLAQIAPAHRSPAASATVTLSDIMVAGVAAKKVVGVVDPDTGTLTSRIYIGAGQGKGPRLVVVKQIDRQPVDYMADYTALEAFVDRFLSNMK